MQLNPVTLSQPVLWVAAGKSGGHLIPALQLAERWHEQHPGGSVVLCTYGTKLDQKIYAQYQFIKHVQIFSFTTFVLKKIWLYPLISFQALKACVVAWQLLRKTRPEKIITTGGFVALPVSIAARLLSIPIEVYELNVHAGKAVKALALLGAKVFVVFQQTLSQFTHASLVSYPVRFTSKDFYSQAEAISVLGKNISSQKPLVSDRKTLFILGGSQGSQYLNDLALKFIMARPNLYGKIQIIHQAGRNAGYYADTYEKYKIPHLVFDFHSAIAACYQAADLVVCRAGAGTLFELKFFKKRAVIIPLVATSTGHQAANATALVEECPELFEAKSQQWIDRNIEKFCDEIEAKLFYS